MRTLAIMIITALLLSTQAYAQSAPSPAQPETATSALLRPFSRIEFGGRVSDVDGDAARWQRYRDLRDGATLDVFRYVREADTWWVDIRGDHVGYRDQRYTIEGARAGKLKAFFQWDQIPLFISADTRTLFADQGDGVLRIDDSIQAGIQNGSVTLRDVASLAREFETRIRRDTATFELLYTATRALDVRFNLETYNRDGNIPFGATFGFSNAVEVPLPIDSRTTNASTAAEWTNDRGMIRVGWDGSWYDNKTSTLVWDNPIRITDSPTSGPMQGRMAIWPGNSFNTLNGAGSIALSPRNQLTGSLAFGWLRQDEALLPNTINAALPLPPIPRTSAEAEARTASAVVNFTSRLARRLGINARYRFDEFENNTPEFIRSGFVNYDTSVVTRTSEPELFSRQGNSLDLEATLTLPRSTSFRVGYGFSDIDRTNRIYENTRENVLRASVDMVGNPLFTVRGLYEFSSREGDAFSQEVLAAANENPGLRHYDVANRDRNRVTLLLTAAPTTVLAFNASVAAGKDDYKETEIGLRDNTHQVYSLGVDLTPRESVWLAVSYTFEGYDSLLNQRQASTAALWTSPTAAWNLDTEDTARSVLASLDLLKIVRNTDVRLGYDYSRSRSVFGYSLPAGSTLRSPVPLPPVIYQWQRGTVDVTYSLSRRLGLGFVYWYDRYRVDDFALGGEIDQGIAFPIVEPGQTSPVNTVLLNYLYRPYTANTAWVRLIYYF